MDVEPIAGVDAANLVFDGLSRVNAFVLAGTLGPGGFVSDEGEVDLDAARGILLSRVRAVPRLNVRADTSRTPWSWVETSADDRVRVEDAPDGLEALCARLMVTPLDRERPLWELLLVPRIAPRRAGLVLRVHHAIADGGAALGIVAALADPDSVGPPPASAALPEPDRGLRALRGAVAQWLELAAGPRLGPTVLLGAVGERRGVRFVRTELAAVQRAAGDATVNDLVLAVIAGAVERALDDLGEPLPTSLPVSVPVAVRRRRGEGNALGNLIAALPLGLAPGARVREIHRLVASQVVRARRRGDAGFARSPGAMRLFVRYAHRQRRLALVTSNVHGPGLPLRFGGAPLLDAAPVSTLGGNVRVSIVVASYAGALSWGVHTDDAAVPAATLAAALRAELTAFGIPELA